MAGSVEMTEQLKPPFSSRPIPPKPTNPLFASQASLSNGDVNGTISPVPVLDTATSIPLTAMDSLPTIAGKGSQVFQADADIKSFLKEELDLSRLNKIHQLLWMAGRPMRARPLHRYKMLGFEVLHTQQMDLHLLKFSNNLLLKPLPEWMLSHEFWVENICNNEGFHKSACGFLLSYVWLLVYPLDLKLAHDLFLLPSFITWHWWKEFVSEFVQHVDMNALDQVNIRYHFGDLRLGRINSIYRSRFLFTHFVRGYLYGYNRYVVFFQRNFSWILIVFVFFSLVLSAMQVGAGIEPLQNNTQFHQVSYGFVVFSMVSVAAVLGFVGFVFGFIFFFNMVAAIRHDKQERRERERLAMERRNKAKSA